MRLCKTSSGTPAQIDTFRAMFKLHRFLKRKPSGPSHTSTAGAPVGSAFSAPPVVDPVARQGLFIIGAARSGTTILQNALNGSREIFLFGEPAFHRDPGTPDFAARYNGMHREWGNQENKSSHCPRLFRHDARWRDYLEKLTGHYRYVGSKIVINPHDATAECRELLDFQCRHFYGSRHIFTFRNPLDVLMSTRGLSELNGGRVASCAEVVRGYFTIVQLYFSALRTLPRVSVLFHESMDVGVFHALGRDLELDLSGAMDYYDRRKVRHYTIEQVPCPEQDMVLKAMALYDEFREQAQAGFALPQIEQNNGHLDPAHFTPLGRLSLNVMRFLDTLPQA
jgi:hypothetical protein